MKLVVVNSFENLLFFLDCMVTQPAFIILSWLSDFNSVVCFYVRNF
jgi:hypothetical protein